MSAPKFGGGEKCASCSKSVYANESLVFEKKTYHKICFKCVECKKTITNLSGVACIKGVVYDKNCFMKIFKTRGKYNDFGEDNLPKHDKERLSNAEPASRPAATSVPKNDHKEEPKKESPKEAPKEEPKHQVEENQVEEPKRDEPKHEEQKVEETHTEQAPEHTEQHTEQHTEAHTETTEHTEQPAEHHQAEPEATPVDA